MVIRCLTLACLAILYLTQGAEAGAWPRGDGAGFLQLQLRQPTTGLAEAPIASAYLEYGLTPSVTAGGKMEIDLDAGTLSSGMLFGRWHFTSDSFPFKSAVEIAVEGNEDRLWVTPTLHLGKGFDTAFGPGWIDTTLSTDLFADGNSTAYTGFAQIGFKPADRLLTMMGIEAMYQSGQSQVKLIPSIAWEFGEGRHLTGSYTHTRKGDTLDELSLGLWLNF